ncbi:retrovirus-related Pol polyprotein from transposon 17.6 [Trichonephila clavipes]|uniref:RNA-directed DNA polymerase n=1 Tax=Trichonephila clavipes TaxID=2585209 RepID=A0A8X6T2C0_TRICX|nr:retrovirus-related Pol polyprotein from transposon 17.6 [Trichonephila clavipes]
MLKGYWSIPMEDSSKHLTAFRTHRGQYQWNVLPFGLRNAAATYQRAMSKVVQTISDFACRHSPDKERIKAIQNLQAPTTKKQLRSALGLCNFYRQYIPNIAKIALPLTELTIKKVPNEIPWSKEAENAFKELKTALCGITELQVPDRETVLLAYGCFSDGGRMLSRSIGWRRQHSSHSFWEPETEPKPTKVVNN